MEVLVHIAIAIVIIVLFINIIYITLTSAGPKYTPNFIGVVFFISMFCIMFIVGYLDKETGKNKVIRTFHRIEPKVEPVVIRSSDTVFVDSVFIYK